MRGSTARGWGPTSFRMPCAPRPTAPRARAQKTGPDQRPTGDSTLLVGELKDAELGGETVMRIKSIYDLDNPKEWIANQIKKGKELRIYDGKKADGFLNGFGYKAGRTENCRLGDIVQSVEENVK